MGKDTDPPRSAAMELMRVSRTDLTVIYNQQTPESEVRYRPDRMTREQIVAAVLYRRERRAGR